MGYLTYSRGFKAGGINLDNNAAGLVANNPAYAALGAALHFVPAPPLDPTYRPEKIDGVEAGFKADYLDGRARSNLALFYDKITGLQVGEFQGLQFLVVNAPSGRTMAPRSKIPSKSPRTSRSMQLQPGCPLRR